MNLLKLCKDCFRKETSLFASRGGWVLLIIFFGLFLLGFLIARNENSEIQTIRRTQILMGTVVEIQAKDRNKDNAEIAISKAFEEIKRIDNLFSSYNQNSPVWKLNHNYIFDELPNELTDIISFCDSIWEISNGAFDVSLGNLIELWSFNSNEPVIPNIAELKTALNNSGWKNVRLSNVNNYNPKRNLKFDFGAVAKGYAVDRAIEKIKELNISSALINAGGEVKAFGNDWIIGIQHPRNKNGILSKIKLNDMSVATSGDYEQFFELNGKRYHHILNPKSGMSADGCQSVTVICKENKLADALSTAVFVMGIEDGLKLVDKLDNVETMIVASDGKIISSNGFNKFLVR